MKNSTNFKAWGAFSLFVWLHALPGVYHFPWQQLENGAIEQNWLSWIISVLYLSFGLLFTRLLFMNSRRWPILMGGLTLICLFHTSSGVYALATINGTVYESLSLWSRLIVKWLQNGEIKQLLRAYLIWSWPLYGVILLWFSGKFIWLRYQEHEAFT